MNEHQPHHTTPGERLARIETKIDALLERHDDQEDRIRKVERQVTSLWGGGTVLAAIVAFLGTIFGILQGASENA